MDFRGPDVGDFVYHCHILDHEDGGMMAIIRVLPRTNPPGEGQAQATAAARSQSKRWSRPDTRQEQTLVAQGPVSRRM